jgi:hypothetical protein
MPSIELKPARNRKRGRSRLHLSSTAHSPTSPVPPTDPIDGTATALQPTTINTTTTTTGSSSSDERQEKSPSASSISSSSFFDDEHWRRVIRKREQNGLRDTVQWGYFLLLTTWVVFVLGIGGVCGVWEWSLKSIRTDTKNRIVSSWLGRLWLMWVDN